jgi:periodic tryptophan protein 2
MTKFNYQFSRLCGSVFSSGNLLYLSSGTSLLSPVGNRLSLFDLSAGTSRTYDFECRADIRFLALTSDDRLLLVVDEGNHALLVNLARGAVLHRFAFKKRVRCVTFSPDDRHFAVSYGKHVQVWVTPALRREVAPFVLHRTYTGQHEDVVMVRWTPDSRFFVAASKDNTARVFSLDTTDGFEPTTLAGHRAPLVGAFFGAEPTCVHTVSSDGAVFTWKWAPLDALEEIEGAAPAPPPPPASPLVGGSWSLSSRHFFNQEGSSVVCASLSSPSSSSSLLAVGFSTGVFGLYDLPSCACVHTLSVSKHHISACAVSPAGDWLAFGCPTLGQLLVWEWQSET